MQNALACHDEIPFIILYVADISIEILLNNVKVCILLNKTLCLFKNKKYLFKKDT
jgi:hypothetical protein